MWAHGFKLQMATKGLSKDKHRGFVRQLNMLMTLLRCGNEI